jgi:hypothetical protein
MERREWKNFKAIHYQNTNIKTQEIADFNKNCQSQICMSVDQHANEINLYHHSISRHTRGGVMKFIYKVIS